ncbi:hypothetical protein AMATHDRAFT_67898 [Amanita thiersii Skay4041]|uniref:Uncharacterized protein n=1 Tax=Amanita thiersii Skay4041 TaxID=703135 RepID=A0A2A9N9S8_9AGAR|nr:hypothetical protein AMATHDRAFT_67898 [Amanita thiersii Skay4041]
MPCNVDDLEREHAMVTRWGGIVPSLSVCTLTSGTRWTRYRPDAWFPDRGGLNAETKAQWLFRAILAIKFPMDMYNHYGGDGGGGQALVIRLREERGGSGGGVGYPVLLLGEVVSSPAVLLITNEESPVSPVSVGGGEEMEGLEGMEGMVEEVY